MRIALTPIQRILIRHQRSRLRTASTAADNDENVDDSNSDDGEFRDEREPKELQKLFKVLQNFTPSSNLDKNLLLGLLGYDEHEKKQIKIDGVNLEEFEEKKIQKEKQEKVEEEKEFTR